MILIVLASCLLTCRSAADRTTVRTGADRLFEEPYRSWIVGKRVGLITNQTGVDSTLTLVVDRLDSEEGVSLVAIFGPEHGFLGGAQAGDKIFSEGRVFSLYGDTRGPTPEMLQGVDVLIYDIQDAGSRFYTFISTLTECMKAAALGGIPLIVLDRPAPLNGLDLSGPVLEPGYESFVGIHTIPNRYAMTPAEIASMINEESSIGADLRVVPLEGWTRDRWFDETGLQWIAPSPNMPTLSTATVYPGFCLFEGTNLSEGRGTTRPFQLIGAPWLESRELADRLNARGLPGVRFRTQNFKPVFSKFENENIEGIQVHVLDRDQFQPVETALSVIEEIRDLHPAEFEFRDAGFDRLAGNSWIREEIAKKTPVAEIVGRWSPGLDDFERRRRPFLIYR